MRLCPLPRKGHNRSQVGEGVRVIDPYPYKKLPHTHSPNPISGLGGGCGGRAGASGPWPSPHLKSIVLFAEQRE